MLYVSRRFLFREFWMLSVSVTGGDRQVVIVAVSPSSPADVSPSIAFIPGESATGLGDSTLSWVLSDTAGRVSGGVFSLQDCPCC